MGFLQQFYEVIKRRHQACFITLCQGYSNCSISIHAVFIRRPQKSSVTLFMGIQTKVVYLFQSQQKKALGLFYNTLSRVFKRQFIPVVFIRRPQKSSITLCMGIQTIVVYLFYEVIKGRQQACLINSFLWLLKPKFYPCIHPIKTVEIALSFFVLRISSSH